MSAISESTNQTDNTAAVGRARPLLIVDASNVAFGNSGLSRKPSLATLRVVLEKIPVERYEVKVLADASLRHRIDRKEEYEALVRSGVILQTPAGRTADQFMAHLARKRRFEGQRVLILTNDLLRQYLDLEPLRATFLMVEDGEVIFDPPLEPASPVPSMEGLPVLADPVHEVSL